jgi:glycosyltransferase involved in cell wall biosynthesis
MSTQDTMPASQIRPLISVVVPVFNEATQLVEFWRRLSVVSAGLAGRYRMEAVFVEDGSSDNSFAVLGELCAQDSRVVVVKFSRNFGKEAALTAGLDQARGDWVVVIDADLQDPPELIPELIAAAENGFDVALARRSVRRGETPAKRATSKSFYWVMNLLNPQVRIPFDTGDYRLMSRRVVDAVLQLREGHRFMKGVFAWVGFRTTTVSYERKARYAGASSYNYLKMIGHATDGITSFSTVPLRIATWFGLLCSSLALGYGAVIVIRTLILGEPVRGFPTLMAGIFFLGGVQLLCLGIIGEYVGRGYEESKRRPLYIVEQKLHNRL